MSENSIVSCVRYIARVLKALNCEAEMPSLPEGVGYRDVYRLAKKHSLAGALWYKLEGAVTPEVDADLFSVWSRERDVEFLQFFAQKTELDALVKSFTDANIPFLTMKGCVIRALWHKPEYRTMSDMDIYVSPEYSDRAGEVIFARGFSPDGASPVHDNFFKPPYVKIELHKSIYRDAPESYSDWIQSDDNPYSYRMSEVDFLVYHIKHMHKHFEGGGCGIRPFFDTYLYLDSYSSVIDKEELERKLDAFGISDFYSLVLDIIALWFSDTDTEPKTDTLEAEYYIATGGVYGTLTNRVDNQVRSRGRLAYFISRTFLPYRDMRDIYKWLPRAPYLLPFTYIHRLLKALFDGRMRNELKAYKNREK